MTATKQGVYLLCFDTPYKHSKHYCGWGKNVHTRVDAQLQNKRTAAKFVKVVHRAGIKIHLARLWTGADRKFERKLKDSHNLKHYCPRCKAFVEVETDVNFYGE